MSGDSNENQINEKLTLSKVKLDALLKVTIGINENLAKEELLKLFFSVLYNDLKIGKIGLFINDSKTNNSLLKGFSSQEVDKIDWEILSELVKSIHVTNQNDPEFLRVFDVVIPIKHKEQDLAYLLLSDFDGEKLEVSPIIKHLHFIQTLTNILLVAFENKRLYQENVNKATLQREMELAKKMQQLLIPNELIQNNSYQFNSLYLPYSDVGGDYFDVIQLPDNKVGFCVADVSGKGISAALLMANFQANLRTLIHGSKSLEELVIKLNKRVIESGGMEKFITLFVGIYNPKDRMLSTVNCGHNPPLLFQNSETIELKKGTTVLGMFPVLPEILVENHSIAKNAKLLCYTDGISEITNVSGEEFGINQLVEILENYPPKEITEMVKKRADAFRGSKIIPDDITLLSCFFY